MEYRPRLRINHPPPSPLFDKFSISFSFFARSAHCKIVRKKNKEDLYSLSPGVVVARGARRCKNRSDSRQRRYNLSSWNWLPFCVIEEPMADEDLGARNWPFMKLIAEWISCARTLTIQEWLAFSYHFPVSFRSLLSPSTFLPSMETNLANFSKKYYPVLMYNIPVY